MKIETMKSSDFAILENLYQEELYLVPSPVLIVISKNWNELSDDDKALLTKILNSVKLTLASVQIITTPKFSVSDFDALSPRQIIVFGANPTTPSKMYEHLVLNGISVIYADALNSLDDAKKKSLWLALKQMFGI